MWEKTLIKKKHNHDSQLDSIYKVKLSKSKETSGSDSKALIYTLILSFNKFLSTCGISDNPFRDIGTIIYWQLVKIRCRIFNQLIIFYFMLSFFFPLFDNRMSGPARMHLD